MHSHRPFLVISEQESRISVRFQTFCATAKTDSSPEDENGFFFCTYEIENTMSSSLQTVYRLPVFSPDTFTIKCESSKTAIYLFLFFTATFSSAFWILIIWSGHLDMGFGLVIPGIMWCPGLAAIATCRLLKRPVRSLAWRWPNSKYLAAAYFLPLAYITIAYGAVWSFRLAGWNSEYVTSLTQGFGLKGCPAWGALALALILMGTGGVIQNLSMTLGEEIGWRGLLLPELAKQMSFTKASLLSGLIWAVWHIPLLLYADYNAGTNRWYALGCSSITCISVGLILAWLTLKSRSLWPAAVLHASHNLFLPIVFDNIIRNTGLTLWYTTVFGAALATTSTVFALYFWKRRTEISIM